MESKKISNTQGRKLSIKNCNTIITLKKNSSFQKLSLSKSIMQNLDSLKMKV